MSAKPVCVTLTTGRIVDLWKLTPQDVELSHIVGALSIMPRYGCRTTLRGEAYPYTVLQHSLFLAQLVPSRYRRQALSHDFTEAYLPDLVSTIKELTPWYISLENHIWDVQMVALDLEPIEQIVWDADVAIREIERSVLFPNQRRVSRPHPYLDFVLDLPPRSVRAVFQEAWAKYSP